MIKKQYKQILPLNTEVLIKEQFGWNPVSIIRPEKKKEYRELIGDDGDIQNKRGKDCKYLPNLRYSEFNPHLAEMVVKYWSIEGQVICDPFAGRGTRGIISLINNRKYTGYEISPITFNKYKAKINLFGGTLINKDGCLLEDTLDDSVDLVFTCPPYYKLEKYESVTGQLSDEESYDTFMKRIQVSAKNIFRVLKQNGFVCWVCADWRDKGEYVTFHIDTINEFKDAGFRLHDIVVIENITPFAAVQAGKVASKRYTSKIHEYLLVFRKKDVKE